MTTTSAHRNGEADRPNIVREVQVVSSNETLNASYYVEDDILVVMVEGSSYRCPVGSVPYEDTVRAMITEIAVAKRSKS